MRMHVNLRVKDLEASIRFYAGLFGAAPSVTKHDYARWMLEDPRVNFAIVKAKGSGGLEHLGIQAESTAELARLKDRAARTGVRVDDEGEVTCCYARSDKAWVTDEQGLLWEMFYTHGSAEEAPSAAPIAAGAARESSCCAPECCSDDRTASSHLST